MKPGMEPQRRKEPDGNHSVQDFLHGVGCRWPPKKTSDRCEELAVIRAALAERELELVDLRRALAAFEG